MDLSQSINRNGYREDGSIPTVTPGAIIASRSLGRVLTPLDKLLVHGFPVHRIKFPSTLTDRDVASLGGNTMHVHVVGIAMLLALSAVAWQRPASRIVVAMSNKKTLRRVIQTTAMSKLRQKKGASARSKLRQKKGVGWKRNVDKNAISPFASSASRSVRQQT